MDVSGSSLSTTQPRWPRTRPPRTWNTCTAASSSSSANATTSASVPSPNTTACFSIARRSASRSSRSRAASSNSRFALASFMRRSSRLIMVSVLPAMKSQKSSTICRCSSARDPADARRAALADVAEQARPADLPGALEHAGRAGPRREHAQQQVERLADRPGVAVRAEVPHALALGAAHHLQPGVLLVQGDRERGIGLVVAVADVEPRVELLDPGVLELQRLDLGADDRPLDARGRRDHLPGALVQVAEVGEVGVQPLAQALRLADVDDPAALIAELVDPRFERDRARRGPVGRGIGHAIRG